MSDSLKNMAKAPARDDVPYYLPVGNEVALFEHAWRNRLPVLLVYQEHLSATEAAQVLGVPLRTLYARLQHAYAEMSRDLDLQYLEPVADRMVKDVNSKL